MAIIITKQPPLPPPSTNSELIQAINGFRIQLDEFSSRMSSNLEWLVDGLQARLDAISKDRS